MVRKEPLDMGVNSRDPSQPIPEPVDSRKPPYDVLAHFEGYPTKKKKLGKDKLCHAMIQDMEKVPKLTQRPKPTSNNLKLDELGGSERKYLVLTLQELLSLN